MQLLKDAYEEKRLEYLTELNDKEQNLLLAREKGSSLDIANLEREIADFRIFIRQWQEIKIKKLKSFRTTFSRAMTSRWISSNPSSLLRSTRDIPSYSMPTISA